MQPEQFVQLYKQIKGLPTFSSMGDDVEFFFPSGSDTAYVIKVTNDDPFVRIEIVWNPDSVCYPGGTTDMIVKLKWTNDWGGLKRSGEVTYELNFDDMRECDYIRWRMSIT